MQSLTTDGNIADRERVDVPTNWPAYYLFVLRNCAGIFDGRAKLKFDMRFGVQILASAIGLPLQVLVVAALLRGSWRRFPLLLAFAALELATSLVLAPGALEAMLGLHPPGLPFWITYWTGEVINQLLLYAVVISLLYRAAERLRSARAARTLLVLAASLVAGGTFLAHYDPTVVRGVWLTPWFRDLNFTCALMDIVLWSSLVVTRGRDRQVLLLSGGLGVQFAGAALGESLRQMSMQSRSHPLAMTGGLIMVATSLFRTYTWWQALRQRQRKETAPAELEAVCERESSL